MSQPKITVIESLDELRSLIRRHRDTPREPRLKLLLALKEDSTYTITSLASVVNISAPTAKRWLALYRKSGLQALLAMRGGGSRRVGDVRIHELQRMLNANEIQTVEEVYRWLEQAKVVTQDDTRSGVEKGADVHPPAIDLSASIVMLLNDLPMAMDHVEWIRYFQRMLLKIIPGVDRFVVAINTECDLIDPQNYHPDMEAVQIASFDGQLGKKRQLNVAQPGETTPSHRMLNTMRDDSFPFDEYHSPYTIDYFVDGTAYLGTIILLRAAHRSSISEHSIDVMRSLERFIVFMLSDCVVRQKYARPVATAFNKAFGQISDIHELSPTERRVFVLQLLGQSYEEIATSLNISANTVKFHIGNIHSKTGEQSISKLFARYFTPLITTD